MALPISNIINMPVSQDVDDQLPGSSIIMTDVETGLRYKIIIRNGELCIEGTDKQSKREINLKNLLK